VSIQDFDNLTAALADRAVTRRRALRLAAASALGAAGLGLAAGEAQATHDECPRRGVGCCRRCEHTGQRVCVCVRNMAGNRRCVHRCCPEDTTPCNERADCGEGEQCIRLGSCARCAKANQTEPGVCMRRCEVAAGDDCVRYPC
jgi:hypothetical protein